MKPTQHRGNATHCVCAVDDEPHAQYHQHCPAPTSLLQLFQGISNGGLPIAAHSRAADSGRPAWQCAWQACRTGSAAESPMECLCMAQCTSSKPWADVTHPRGLPDGTAVAPLCSVQKVHRLCPQTAPIHAMTPTQVCCKPGGCSRDTVGGVDGPEEHDCHEEEDPRPRTEADVPCSCAAKHRMVDQAPTWAAMPCPGCSHTSQRARCPVRDAWPQAQVTLPQWQLHAQEIRAADGKESK